LASQSNLRNIGDLKYVPARKFFASLIILSKDFSVDKAEQLFTLYDGSLQGILLSSQLKEFIEHMFFTVLYAFPSMVD
jgi:hypothetical protein